ncbi:flagellar basal-body rod modification protein FlgD [Vibrio maritimus]|uniref:Flagellar basal-body rod modification protein FlgD n=1 Tax=Vibrio maritimus TaxID=990268 RepID=A0A090S4R4_9VIBR|nr:flagellar basal-body rod modification protein FlgD [Vibrio maritimus]
MAGINNVGQGSLSYLDQLKNLQEQNKAAETTGKQDLKQEDFLSLLTKQLSQQDRSSLSAMTK